MIQIVKDLKLGGYECYNIIMYKVKKVLYMEK